ncbi:hypothetical protein CONLIGDRAFT_579694 [Coniochaeta ligniaria NRRL 30616]|uniref:Bulb-type lectin domain-containing protein n=1 Tax=Coniochaeta ligniaria NRRL 30616 TaxID=1408157 RepID=A0A1J7J3J9_9PEZI|nr:hypothetical protein CONLIGDRAFT_579694 [Coniochaeta ligniaria NRRL 30616]
MTVVQKLLAFSALATVSYAACISSGSASTINAALQAGGTGAVVQLCPNAVFTISETIQFTAENQELSTQGYPTDNSRAKIIIAVGSNITSAVWGRWTSGVKVLNLQVDGNRPNAGAFGGDALVEMGGGSFGQVVSNNVITNTRSWSCLHYIGSGQDDNPCREGTVSGNTIGPCGTEGTDASGNGLWADGVSFECVNSVVSSNNITGSTDGGIVIFGSPGSQFVDNIITSSATQLGFGAINMVDPSYGGNYSNVLVKGNTIIGQGTGLFNLGIGIGNQVWSNQHPDPYFGPATITNNKFIGNVGFSIVINGWRNGLTVTGNDISGITTPSSSFADAGQCQPQVQTSFNANEELIVYQPSIAGPSDFQSDFTSVPQNATNWLCLKHPLPSAESFATLSVNGQASTVVDLAHFHVQIQGDGNVVGLDTTGGVWTVKWASGPQSSNCGADGSSCVLFFGSDGDLSVHDAVGQVWHSATSGTGKSVVFSNSSPYLQVLNAAGAAVWSIADGVKT